MVFEITYGPLHDNDNSEIPYQMFKSANLLYEQREFNKALTCYNELLTSEQDLPPNHEAAVVYNMGLALIQLKRLNEARSCFHAAVKLNNLPNAWNNLGCIEQAQQNYDGAMPHYDVALTVDSSLTFAMINKANLLAIKEDYSEAIVCYDIVLAAELNNNKVKTYKSFVITRLGITCYYDMNYAKANEYFDQALELNSANCLALSYKSVIAAKQGRVDEGLLSQTKAIELNKDEAEIWHNGGTIHFLNDDFKQAKQYYTRAINIDPLLISTWNNLALLSFFKYKYDQSEYRFAKILDNTASVCNKKLLARIWKNRAIVVTTCKKPQMNLGTLRIINKYYKNSWELNPEDVNTLVDQGLVNYSGESYRQARTCFEEALRINQDSAKIWHYLGLAHYQLCDYEKAIECFDRALNLDPTLERAAKDKKQALDWQNSGDAFKLATKASTLYVKMASSNSLFNFNFFTFVTRLEPVILTKDNLCLLVI